MFVILHHLILTIFYMLSDGFTLVFYLFYLIPLLSSNVRRLRDTRVSIWLCLGYFFVPYIVIIISVFLKSKEGHVRNSE
ncbi:DUF805 domain-containing protein [Rahnella sp. PCH160]|uniref:DUF805 domain-containing protein n=1 Tax=Rahnella sp. PCH160 TaxID=3447928 RepID=UPI0039FBEDCB